MRLVRPVGLLTAALLVGCAPDAVPEEPGPTGPVEITERTPLLDPLGNLVAPGWARGPLWDYDPARVKEPDRCRQWDYVAVVSPTAVVQANVSNVYLIAYTSIDFETFATGDGDSVFAVDAPDNVVLPDDPETGYALAAGTGQISTGRDGDAWVIHFERGVPGDDNHFLIDIAIEDPPDRESVAVAQPFTERAGLFFYENKRVGMTVTAHAETSTATLDLSGDDVYATRDWGRGCWPEDVSWLWATAGGVVDGRRVGINLGTVYSDESRGNPNALIVDGVVDKLDRVDWSYDPTDLYAPWTLRDPDGRLDLVLTPVSAENAPIDLGEMGSSSLDKAYGLLSGTATLRDGTVLAIDGLTGAAEAQTIRW